MRDKKDIKAGEVIEQRSIQKKCRMNFFSADELR
jgi:hypothetical protein